MTEAQCDLVLSFPEYERVFELPAFKQEWIDKFKETGQLPRMTISLKNKVKHINAFIDADFLADNIIEKLKGVPDLYSIRVEPRSINARVISVLCIIDKAKCMVLLYAFQEKNTTNTKKKSYTVAENIAKERYEQLKKSFCE